MEPRWSARQLAVVLCFAVGVIFVSGTLLPPLPLFITDNGNKYIVMRDLAVTGTFNIEHDDAALFPTGGFHFQHLPDGSIQSFHSWVLPALTVPFYLAAGENGALIPIWLAGAGILLMLAGSKRLRFAAWGMLLTAPLLLYSLMLWEMIPSVCAALGAFLLIKQRRFLWAGVVFGIGIWFREELYILGGIAGILLLIRKEWKAAAFLASGALAAVIPLWAANFFITGHWLGLHGATYAFNNRPETFSFIAELQGIAFNFYQHLLRFETLSPQTSFILAAIGGAALLIPGMCRKDTIKVAGLTIFMLIDLIFITALYRSSSPLFTCGMIMSLFFSLPLAAGYFVNLRQLLNDRNKFLRFTAQAVLIYIFFIPLLLTRFDIGLTFGARHYMCIMPLLMILSFRGFARMKIPIKAKQFSLLTLTVSGIVLQLWGIKTLYLASSHSADFEAHIAAHPEAVVVTDVFFLPEQTPRIFFDKKCFEVTSDEQADLLLTYLKKHDINDFILILGRENRFRRIENKTLKKLLDVYPPAAKPVEINAAPDMPLFTVRCRKQAAPPAVR